ncbi:MAG TPA: CBS domain-containing protein [Methanolinea sp.]|jgi:CBS domain-containing protein|nr:MAG: inosine 5'-monophosphate dehydrogenase [Methanoregulaceae archaeon PtaU1.Bin066]HNQ30425.1 CBS domain-containing protein [Methanolinea sp.]
MVAPEKPGIEFPSVVDRAYQEYKRHLKVSDIMSTEVVVTTPQASMAETARIMGERRIGSLIVVQYGTPIAIVTERDLLSKVLAGEMDLEKTRVADVMSFPLIKICPDLEIREAARTMIRKKGRLAVFQCGMICGVITASDLIREMPDAPETSLVVDDFMTREVVCVKDSQKIEDVARIMGRKRIGSVIVTESGTPRGIFTERDLLSTLIAKGVSLGVPAGEVCSPMLVTAPAGISIHEAAKIMAAKHIRRLPLMKKKKLAGIITARDLVEAYAK